MEYLTSGEIAKINRVSDKALRVYEKKGLLIPEVVDPETGRRHYNPEQSFKLDLILQLQQIGFSLDEIVDISNKRDIEHLRNAIADHRRILEEQIEQLRIASAVADGFIQGCDDYLDHPPYDKIILEQLPPRYILRFPIPAEGETDTRAKPNRIEGWDATVRYVRQRIIDKGYPPVLFRDLGSILTLEGAREEDREHPFVTDVFVYIDDKLANDFPESEVLERGTCLTLRGDNAYAADGVGHSTERILRLAEYAGKVGMEPAGKPFGETLCGWPRLLDASYRQEHRLCLPVAYKPAGETAMR